MKTYRNAWGWVLLGTLWVFPSLAGALSNNPATAFPILSAGWGSRAPAMGDNFTAIADDLSALHYNPAGLSQVQQPQFGIIHNGYLVDGFYDDLGAAVPLSNLGTLAVGLGYLNYGSIEQRDVFGNQQGTYTPFDMTASAAYGFPIGKELSLGLGSQWLRQEIAGSIHMGLLWQAGILERFSDEFSFGLNLRNIGVETGGFSLPAEFLFGVAYRMVLAPRNSQLLTLAAGGDLGLQGGNRLGAGFEYALEKSYFLRGGYRVDVFSNPLGGLSGLNFGAGVKFGQIQLDYAFSFVGDLGNIQRFSLSMFLPEEARPKSAPLSVMAPLPPPPDPALFMVPAPTPTPVQSGSVSLMSANGPNGTLQSAPVTLKFQVSSDPNLTAQQLFDQAELKLKIGLKKEAMDLYLQALDKDPNFQKAWNRLGRIYFDKSLESYRKLLELDPQNQRLRDWLKQYPQ